jgi:hypothetical protein
MQGERRLAGGDQVFLWLFLLSFYPCRDRRIQRDVRSGDVEMALRDSLFDAMIAQRLWKEHERMVQGGDSSAVRLTLSS